MAFSPESVERQEKQSDGDSFTSTASMKCRPSSGRSRIPAHPTQKTREATVTLLPTMKL